MLCEPLSGKDVFPVAARQFTLNPDLAAATEKTFAAGKTFLAILLDQVDTFADVFFRWHHDNAIAVLA